MRQRMQTLIVLLPCAPRSHEMPRHSVSSSVQLPPLQTLIDEHGRDVHRFLIATVGHHAADDCYQETWLAALRAYPRLRDAANLRGWLLTIAHRKSIDYLRALKRRAVAVADVPEQTGQDYAPALLIADGQAQLWTLVRELPPKQRTALALRYVFDAPHAEIASVMGTTEEAARRNVHEGLKRLRTEYQR
jgi:RNA polymerase sigma factor (sigma-70 family)